MLIFSVIKQLDVQSTLASSTMSPQSLEQAKNWIEQCCYHHGKHQQLRGTPSLPTRLVRVSKDAKASALSACLVNGSSLPTSTPYLTLSHAWGTVEFTKLTRQNISQFEQSIAIHRLTRAFKDALYVTSELGFQYVWIDCLCIIQDDLEDWMRESKKMGMVYSGAACNISSSAFKNGVHGFMPAQRKSNPAPPTVQIQCSKDQGPVSQSVGGRDFVILEASPWDDIWHGPLFKRGWVLQEQILVILSRALCQDAVYADIDRLNERSNLVKTKYIGSANTCSRMKSCHEDGQLPHCTHICGLILPWKRGISHFGNFPSRICYQKR